MGAPPKCGICEQLLANYRKAAANLTLASQRLASSASGLEFDLFDKAWSEIREIHASCESLRRQLLVHMKSHRRPDPA
jgi:hypothetical protein